MTKLADILFKDDNQYFVDDQLKIKKITSQLETKRLSNYNEPVNIQHMIKTQEIFNSP